MQHNILSEKWSKCLVGQVVHVISIRIFSLLQIKKLLRKKNWPPGHKIRASLWQEICKLNNPDFNAYKASYESEVWEEHIGDFLSHFL